MNTQSQSNKPTMKARRTGFLRDERGAGMIEYTMLAGLIALVAFTVFQNIGTKVDEKAGLVETKLNDIK